MAGIASLFEGIKPQNKRNDDAGGDGGARKVQAVAGDVETKLDLSLKLGVCNATQGRWTEAATQSSTPLKVGGKFESAYKQAHEHYLSLVKGCKNHGLGTGDSFHIAALVHTAAENTAEGPLKERFKQCLAACPAGSTKDAYD